MEWFDRLEAEHDNARTALSWALGGADAELGLRLAGAFSWFWFVRVHFSEGRRWLEEGLAKAGMSTSSARARDLLGLGLNSQERGELEESRTFAEEAFALYRALGDDRGAATCLVTVGWAELLGGEPERAVKPLEQALAAARKSGDEWSIADALNGLAAALVDLGDYERAEAMWEEALVLGRTQQDSRRVASILYNTGYSALCRGDHERSMDLLEEALSLSRELKDTSSKGLGMISLGIAAALRDDYELATDLLEESLVTLRESGANLWVPENLEALAGVAGDRGDTERAARLWGVAQVLRENMGQPWLPHERALHEPRLAEAQSRLGGPE